MVVAVLEHHLIDLDIWTNVKEYLARQILYCPEVRRDISGCCSGISFLVETQASVVELIFHIGRMSFYQLALYRELEPSKLHGDAGMLCQDFGQDFFQ